jgi:hypothetical protein
MEKILDLYRNLSYNRYDVSMCAISDVAFDAWPGAIIRNNLLYAAEQIRIQKTNRTLREQIDHFPLLENHPLYRELKEGFPKGYVLTDFSHTAITGSSIVLRKDDIFTFSLLLIGNFNDYRFYFFEAIREMCERGIGKPLTPFLLSGIAELPPVFLSDFMQTEHEINADELTIRFLTPVNLYRLSPKKNTQLSYQDKTNRFPSLYQLVRSSMLRLQKLYALYAGTTDDTASLIDEATMDSWLEKAGRLMLKSADIQHINLPNSQKKGKKNEMPLSGYVGEQKYAGYFQPYIPLLRFLAALGVGNETVYGLGQFKIE